MVFWRRRLIRGFLAPVAVGSLFCSPVIGHAQPASQPAPSAPPKVPVSVAPVLRKDVPNFLRGLGTVQALQTVQLRSQVDGVLLQVPVTEGQDVKQGEVLAIIDPRPYKAALDAAMAR